MRKRGKEARRVGSGMRKSRKEDKESWWWDEEEQERRQGELVVG